MEHLDREARQIRGPQIKAKAYHQGKRHQDHGKKTDRPPKRGTGVVCTFRESGTSYSLFLWEITKILGMITMPKDTEIRYPDSNNNNRICTSLIRSHLMKATPSPRRHATLGSPHGRVGMLLIICNLCRLFARCACGHTSGANDP